MLWDVVTDVRPDVVISKQGVEDDQEGDIKQEIEPEQWRIVQPQKMVEECQRYNRSIYHSYDSQRAHPRPFALCCQPVRRGTIAQHDCAYEAIKHVRNTGGPNRKWHFWQEEKR